MKAYSYVGCGLDLNPGLIVELQMHNEPVTLTALKSSCDVLKWAYARGYKKVDDLRRDCKFFKSRNKLSVLLI